MTIITVEQAQEYLDSAQIVLPSLIVKLLVDRANSAEPCLVGAGHDDGTITLVLLTLVKLMATLNADARVTSQTSPSGASRSFRYAELGHAWKSLTGFLRQMDTNGCTTGLIPPNPTASNCALFVSPGPCV